MDNTAYYVGLGFYIGALFCDTGDDNDQFMVVSPRRLRQSTLAAIIPQLKAKASDLETILHGTAVAVA